MESNKKRKTGLSKFMGNKVALNAGKLVLLAMLALTTVMPASAVVERSLGGVRIFSPNTLVLKKYGSPSEIRVGTQSTNIDASAGAQSNAFAPAPDSDTPAPVNGSALAAPTANTVTWIYDRPNGGSLEFILSSDGRVVQIHATGYSGAIKTDRGITLGDKINQVYNKYGYPEKQVIDGKILTVYYTEHAHVAFQFYNNKLVGVIVAAVE